LRKSFDIRAIRGTIELETERDTQELVLVVLEPESAHRSGHRSRVTISPSTRGLKMKVKATDLSSFKASLTSTFRLISVILETQRTIREELGG
jgi:tRNA threonylcarbamoyladenosine modification (KEOPS) complex  Pcc1 subunit